MSARIKPNEVRGRQLEEMRDADPDGRPVLHYQSSIRLRGCGARAPSRMPCTMLRGTSKRPSSSRSWSPCAHCRCCAFRVRDGAPDLHEHQLDARRRVHEALEVLGGINSPAGSCAWHVVGCERSLQDWALRQRWSGRPLPQGHAQGILVADSSASWQRRPIHARRRD